MVAFPNPRRRHPFHMHDMILGQPGFVAEALQRTAASDVGSFLGTPRRLVLTGCGTSFHAATYPPRVSRGLPPSVPVPGTTRAGPPSAPPIPATATLLAGSHTASPPPHHRP